MRGSRVSLGERDPRGTRRAGAEWGFIVPIWGRLKSFREDDRSDRSELFANKAQVEKAIGEGTWYRLKEPSI
jgi:hypothetical protein